MAILRIVCSCFTMLGWQYIWAFLQLALSESEWLRCMVFVFGNLRTVATLASCEGDGTTDIVCKLPLGAGTITVKKVTFQIAKGSRQPFPVAVQTSALFSASVAFVDTAV